MFHAYFGIVVSRERLQVEKSSIEFKINDEDVIFSVNELSDPNYEKLQGRITAMVRQAFREARPNRRK